MKKTPWLLPLLLFSLPGWAARCLENRDFYQSLPTTIGREDQTGKFPFALNCDTVFVRKGVTTVLNPGTMLFFSRPNLNSVIKVEGTLMVHGTKNNYVYFSGSLDSSKGGWEPGNRQWGGIEVAEGGKLILEFAGFTRAPTPVTSFSRQVRITNCFFKGSSGIILPDGNLYAMETNWHTINVLDLEKEGGAGRAAKAESAGDGLSAKEKAALLDKKEDGFWTWQKTAGGAAALIVLGAGGYYLLQPGPDEDGNPIIPPEKKNPMDSRPGLPNLK